MQLTKQYLLRNLSLVTVLLFTAGVSLSYAGPREQAKQIHDRLAGVPPSDTVIDSMAAKLSGGDGMGAALEAMENKAFYNTTLREFATPWTNRERSVYVELNDSIATVIGMIRDEVPFDQLLYEDIIYVGSGNATNIAYSQTDNNHYLDLQTNRIDLGDTANLVRQRQSDLPGSLIGIDQTAGIMTTRGFSEAYYVAGTNRSALRFATINFMCMDMEDFSDITAHPDRIRQDVTRSPGGDSKIFLNDCLSCHAGLDGLAGAFAYYDFDQGTEQLVYTAGSVQPKFVKDANTFLLGYETNDDSWINYWRTGPNAFVGWGGPGSGTGTGAKSLGMELSQTRQFAECQVKQVFEKVCYRTPNGQADIQAVENIATNFEANGRSMKRVFAETALHCMGN